MVNLPTGFMKEGEDTIEVKSQDGRVAKNPASKRIHHPMRQLIPILKTVTGLSTRFPHPERIHWRSVLPLRMSGFAG